MKICIATIACGWLACVLGILAAREPTNEPQAPANSSPTPATLESERPLSPEFPHHAELAPGVHVVGFADKHRSANCGWFQRAGDTVLVDLPRGRDLPAYLTAIAASGAKPPRTLVLTRWSADDEPLVRLCLERGVEQVYAPPSAVKLSQVTAVNEPVVLDDGVAPIRLLPCQGSPAGYSLAVHLPRQRVLFAGPLVVHGPRCALAGGNTDRWLEALRALGQLQPAAVVPGYGSWGGAELLARQQRFLAEIRRQVGYQIAQGRPRELALAAVNIPAECLVWMPYDTPLPEDLESIYRELTAPAAPFAGQPPAGDDKRHHALVLIGDQPHEPGHIEEGLRPVFEATGVVAHFTVDVQALSAENLAHVRLLVILRDGLQRPQAPGQADYVWMTAEQERAVVEFVHRGGGFLNLHNAMGLYPEGGPYLQLVGGHYVGHGPLERFRVEVVDREHPITRGVRDFSVADEQHTPPIDNPAVHLLLRNRSDDGQTAAAGWAYEPGKGRLCHLANGHTRESLLHPMYQRLMQNAVLWCLRRND